MKKRSGITLSTTHIILLSFLLAIGIGSLLLALPISTVSGESVPYVDALFTATTATCVTGLVSVPTATTWSVFGQAVILVLIQIGGLGVITVMTGFMLLLNRKMGIADKLLVQDAFNLNTMSGLSKFVRNTLLATLIIECIGALLYMTVFVPEFGARGIWISVFNSVSAFCNAGIDIIGENSLCNYATNPIVNSVTAALIVLGGIGYIVWWDVIGVIKGRNARKRRIFKYLSLHTKIAITSTLILIFGGGLLIFVLEYNNPLTLGGLSAFDKIQVALFQSITTRTAGFATVPQESLTGASSVVSMILMVIGGSPVGTAGGIKTVTAVVLICSAISTVRNKDDATLFNRAISGDSIKKALAVAVTFLFILLLSVILLLATTGAPALDVVYEAISATATVGLTRNFTFGLNTAAKLILIFTMYFGRVGPISLAVAFGSRAKNQNSVAEPTEDISIG